MRIDIIEKNYEASEKLKEIIDKKVSKLTRYFDEDSVCKVYLKKENKSYKMEVTIEYKGNFLRADVLGENFYDNIDVLLPKIEKQIYKYRTKLEKKLKQNAFKDKNLFSFTEEDLKPDILVKTKYFDMEPMTIDEAISELDLVGHSFYVFLEEKSNAMRVIYRRDDGNVGMIVPKF
jgi:putative sigma-54 modulation protein